MTHGLRRPGSAMLAPDGIEHGCTLATCDSDFARFADLRWAHPLQPAG
jgi:predicted nucleic acid-binding protein